MKATSASAEDPTDITLSTSDAVGMSHSGRLKDLNLERRIAWLLGIAVLFFYMAFTPIARQQGDHAAYQLMARNWAVHGIPAIEIQYDPQDKTRSRRPQPIFTIHPVGQALILLPASLVDFTVDSLLPEYAEALPKLANLVPAICSAAIMAFLFRLILKTGQLVHRYRISRQWAVVLAIITALGTELWPYSAYSYADGTVALLLLLAVYSAVSFRIALEQHGAVELRWALAACAALSVALLCRANTVLAVLPVALYAGVILIRIKRRNKRARAETVSALAIRSPGWLRVALTAPLCLLFFVTAIATIMWYNRLRYGSPWLSGYHVDQRNGEWGFSTPFWVGLYGILFSPGRSFFLYSPVCVLGIFGIIRMTKRAPLETWLLGAGLILPQVAVFTRWWAWYGGWDWGSRFFIFAVPLLMWLSLPIWHRIAATLQKFRWSNAGSLLTVALLIAASTAVQPLGILIAPTKLYELTSAEVRVFPFSSYQPGTWELREDTVMVNQVPEFSPIPANAWLMWATWNRNLLPDEELARRAPWTRLLPQWKPARVKPYLEWQPWAIASWSLGGNFRIAACIWLGLCVTGCIVSLLRIRRLLSTYTTSSSH